MLRRKTDAAIHVPQYSWPPLSGHHLGREPRPLDRLRDRRLPSRHCLGGRRDPGVPRQAPARPVAVHHPAARARRRAHPLRRVRRRRRPPGDHRYADLARHRQCRPARARLRRHQGQIPPRPCRFHLPGEIRHPRLPRRRALLRPRDGDARGRRRGCAKSDPRRHHPRRAGPDRQAQDRPRALELGRGRQQSVLLARRRHRRHLVELSRRGAKSRLLGRRRHRGGGRGRARPAGARRSTASSTRTWPAP